MGARRFEFVRATALLPRSAAWLCRERHSCSTTQSERGRDRYRVVRRRMRGVATGIALCFRAPDTNSTRSLRPSAPPSLRLFVGSVPVVQGSVVARSMELWCGDALSWPQSYKALVIAASSDSDLMDPFSWAASAPVAFDECVGV